MADYENNNQTNRQPNRAQKTKSFKIKTTLPSAKIKRLSARAMPIRSKRRIMRIRKREHILTHGRHSRVLREHPTETLITLSRANRAHLKEMLILRSRQLILLSRQLIIRRPAFIPFNRLSKRQMCGMCCFRFSCRLQGLSFSLWSVKAARKRQKQAAYARL